VGIFDLVHLGQLIIQDSLEALLAYSPVELLFLGQAEYFIRSLGGRSGWYFMGHIPPENNND
jgi:hypothetical protein